MLLVVREVSVEIKTVFYKYKDDYFPTITYTSLQANYH